MVAAAGTNAITGQFYAVSAERKLAHQVVLAISSSARLNLPTAPRSIRYFAL